MTPETPIDRAHAEMESSDAARLRFFERLGDAELFLLLTEEARDENLSPELFDLADGRFVLAFDREDRLAAFVGRPAPYAALSGRVLAAMLAGQGVGLGLNLEVAPSATMIPAEALAWLAETLGNRPDEVEARISELTPLRGLPEALLSALDAKLVTAAGLAQGAYLAGVVYDDGARGHLLGFVDAVAGAEPALAKAAAEALTFSGVEAGAIDVGFFAATDPMAAALARVGLQFELLQPATPASAPSAPGMDPDRPPRLK